MSEAGVHFEFYRHLQNAIDDDATRGETTYGTVEPEYGTDIEGFADLVVFDRANRPILVIEAKRPSSSSSRREIDPYSPQVIRQAHDYASELGASYFATFNGERLVLFKTFEEGQQLLQRSTKSYVISGQEQFADTLLDEVSRIKADDEGCDDLDDAFVERIRSLHELVTPKLESELAKKLDEDDEFHDSFVSWANSQGFEYDDAGTDERSAMRENFAEQAAYLLVNKIVFYKILEGSNTYGEDVRPLTVSIHRVQQDLEDHFEEVVDRIDFEAIFEHDDVYDEIPLDSVGERIREFIIELEDQNLQQFDSDVIGRIYEGVIPADRRHELGEYYTPPAICDLITRLTVDDPDDRVMDPACGSGGFLVSAYNRKRDLFAEGAGSHDRILDTLYGIDVNRFPAHLSVINLAIQDLDSYTEDVNVEVGDFFDVGPESLGIGRSRASASGEVVDETAISADERMDAVVANPPYIRQENIENKEKVRNHLSAVGGDHLSKRSDIYAYFVTHATEFLDDGGKLGFITSDRWLDTKYGADLQEFLLDNFTIDAVITFGRQAFDDALVGSCVFIVSKESDETRRDENVAKFVRVNEQLDIDQIVSVVDDDAEPNMLVRTDNYRLVTRRQDALRDEQKWSVFFNAPSVYFDAVGIGEIGPLSEFAEVTRGFTSGANTFYYGRREEWEELGIEEYTDPLLKATGQVNRILFNDEVADEWAYLSVHDLVTQALDETDGYGDVSKEKRVVDWLDEQGHTELLEYIRWGEDQEYHDRPTTSARDIWFDLGDVSPPPIVMTDFTWREHRVIWNEAKALGSTQFYYVEPEPEVDAKLLCGILNSRIVWLMSELKGRWAEGQGMARSRLKVYETEALPIPDPRAYTGEERRRIREAFEALMQREVDLGEDASVETTEDERDELDRAVLEPLGLGDRLGDVKDGVERMVKMREQAAGEDTDVLVERPDETEVVELEGVERSSESTTLSDFGG